LLLLFLPPLEFGLSLFHKGAHAFCRILGCETDGEELEFGIEACPEE
jgi:hypothetical protein